MRSRRIGQKRIRGFTVALAHDVGRNQLRLCVQCNELSLVTILSGCEINNFAGQSAKSVCYNLVAMFDLFRLWLGAVLRLFRTRRSLMLENLALRQQLAVFKRQQPRPRLGAIDKLSPVLGSMEKGTPYRPTGHRCALASIRVQTVLGHALQSAKTSGRWPQDP
jgi:hypothetical protein